MMMYGLPFIILFSLIFMRLIHPLSTGLVLLIQTVLISITTGLFAKSYWFSYILFLIFLGGMLVLFIYVASLAANEQFKVSSEFFFIFFLALIMSFFLIFVDPVMVANKIGESTTTFLSKYSDISNSAMNVSTIYNEPSAMFTMFIISYLLLTLFVVVKVMSSSSSPLRLMTYDNTIA
uniref:NADH-ubiquinone oxidoreductase chain 6 n=1 Tax=Coenobita brevimanus TaxID=1547439 RepID=A0A3Q8B8J5_9EUCA|nr:NADH dehydrogenase subunit 6 [Coenobita brevimanus]ASS30608.1 NADH dehydrogenase subunit 6 [Coenobita brevimanus]QNA48316.1 NADH dehydrogenase subunit 6 [Coenobita brevimanus]QUL61633.1 NADH dehydrogenase subunit 6 [Coenobita brevimanus]